MTDEEIKANLDAFNGGLEALLKQHGFSALKSTIEVVPIINETTPMEEITEEVVTPAEAQSEAPVEEVTPEVAPEVPAEAETPVEATETPAA